MNRQLLTLKSKIFNLLVLQLGIGIELFRALMSYLKVNLLYHKRDVIRAIAEHQKLQSHPPKVMAVIAHVTSVEEAKDREVGSTKIEKLKNTLDSLIASLAHCELTIVIKTVPDRHITGYLPDYQINCIEVQEEAECDPMFIGFRCQDELIKRVDHFDWFIFLEDDILLADSYLLEKLKKFTRFCGDDRAVLLPNRYEFWQGFKSYIDLTIDNQLAYNGLSIVEIEGVKFVEFTNPHSGFFCLSKSQITLWMASGREWKDKNLGFGGPRECAATYSLLECFYLYKAHPANLHFLEVKHYDTKYSQLLLEPSIYKLSPIKSLTN